MESHHKSIIFEDKKLILVEEIWDKKPCRGCEFETPGAFCFIMPRIEKDTGIHCGEENIIFQTEFKFQIGDKLLTRPRSYKDVYEVLGYVNDTYYLLKHIEANGNHNYYNYIYPEATQHRKVDVENSYKLI